jgi:hypothetical protein
MDVLFFSCGAQASEPHPFLKAEFPNTQRAVFETIWIPQTALLGDDEDMHEIAAAWQKIPRFTKELA